MMQLIMGHEVSVLPKPLFQNEKKLKCRVFDLKIVATKLSGSRVYVRWPWKSEISLGVLHDPCSQFLLGITVVPSEIENI